MRYRRRATPLHAARAGAGGAWCLALGLAALLCDDPLVLGTLAVVMLTAGVRCRCAGEMGRALRLAVPVALAIALVNALVVRNGLTVVWRFGDLPVLGQTDVTLEACVEGLVLGLRALDLLLCGTLFTVVVDPDELLRGLRRGSLRSALSATLATRLVPVLSRDARRLAEAQRCRPGRPPSRLALLRATCGGVLDRSLDVAAALEVRGYALARPRRSAPRPWSRIDLAVLAGAGAVLALAGVGAAGGAGRMRAYPLLHVAAGAPTGLLCAGLAAAALVPLALRRGVAG